MKPLTRQQSSQYQSQPNQKNTQQPGGNHNNKVPAAKLHPNVSNDSFGALGFPQSLHKIASKQSSINAIGMGRQQSNISGGNHLKKRESKRLSKISPQTQQELFDKARLLESYNDKKALQESKELPTRQVYLRRIGLQLVKITKTQQEESKGEQRKGKIDNGEIEFLFKFPILEYVEEVSKIMLLSEFELAYWYLVLERYLQSLADNSVDVQEVTASQVRLIFFQTAMFVKYFLLLSEKKFNSTADLKDIRQKQINCIIAYVKEYHYQNFEEAYDEFDRVSKVLLGDDFQHFKQMSELKGKEYAQFSFLNSLQMSTIHKTFQILRMPFQIDKNENIIDYNWHVDGILKNSQSYNKEGKKLNGTDAVVANSAALGNAGQVPEPAVIQNKDMHLFRTDSIFTRTNSTILPKRQSEIFSKGLQSKQIQERPIPSYYGGGGGFTPGSLTRNTSSYHPQHGFPLAQTNDMMSYQFDYYNLRQPQLSMNISQVFNNPQDNNNNEGVAGIDQVASPQLRGFMSFDGPPANIGLPKPLPTVKPGNLSYQFAQQNQQPSKGVIPNDFDPSKLFELGRGINLMETDEIGQQTIVNPSMNREQSLSNLFKGFSNPNMNQGIPQIPSYLRNSGFGFGSSGFGSANNNSAFSAIQNSNGLSKQAPQTNTSMSKINSIIGNYPNPLMGALGKTSSDFILETFNRLNNSAPPKNQSPPNLALNLAKHPSMRDIATEEEANQQQNTKGGKGGKAQPKNNNNKPPHSNKK